MYRDEGLINVLVVCSETVDKRQSIRETASWDVVMIVFYVSRGTEHYIENVVHVVHGCTYRVVYISLHLSACVYDAEVSTVAPEDTCVYLLFVACLVRYCQC